MAANIVNCQLVPFSNASGFGVHWKWDKPPPSSAILIEFAYSRLPHPRPNISFLSGPDVLGHSRQQLHRVWIEPSQPAPYFPLVGLDSDTNYCVCLSATLNNSAEPTSLPLITCPRQFTASTSTTGVCRSGWTTLSDATSEGVTTATQTSESTGLRANNVTGVTLGSSLGAFITLLLIIVLVFLSQRGEIECTCNRNRTKKVTNPILARRISIAETGVSGARGNGHFRNDEYNEDHEDPEEARLSWQVMNKGENGPRGQGSQQANCRNRGYLHNLHSSRPAPTCRRLSHARMSITDFIDPDAAARQPRRRLPSLHSKRRLGDKSDIATSNSTSSRSSSANSSVSSHHEPKYYSEVKRALHTDKSGLQANESEVKIILLEEVDGSDDDNAPTRSSAPVDQETLADHKNFSNTITSEVRSSLSDDRQGESSQHITVIPSLNDNFGWSSVLGPIKSSRMVDQKASKGTVEQMRSQLHGRVTNAYLMVNRPDGDDGEEGKHPIDGIGSLVLNPDAFNGRRFRSASLYTLDMSPREQKTGDGYSLLLGMPKRCDHSQVKNSYSRQDERKKNGRRVQGSTRKSSKAAPSFFYPHLHNPPPSEAQEDGTGQSLVPCSCGMIHVLEAHPDDIDS
ncbi:unnamed protein product [Protopolystoma xenopodis]|uniref:Uncharacterized protein n=1 Tax=Protopolystoma xenopodis TaxID=117903 RepID=A0A448XE99_9PLAT|nr:unnamed protein product [Protopolystoma xenopodis]